MGLGLIAGTHLPFLDVFSQLPFMSRLLWPERFGMLIAIGMIVMVSRIPKAFWIIPIAFAEFNWRSTTFLFTQPIWNLGTVYAH